MDKSPDAFRSIGEVSRLVGVAPHVLRYWETQFTHLSPVKRSDGRRYYRPDDVRLVAGLCQVMREEGLSIRGAKRLISADRGAGLRRLGAERLGDIMRDLSKQAPAQIGAAAGLHLPESSEAVSAPQNGEPSRSAAPKRRRSQTGAELLPLFPDPQLGSEAEWLLRLCTAASELRRREFAGSPPPARARDLRDRLHALL